MGKNTHLVTRTTARRRVELGALVIGILAVTAITTLVMSSELHRNRDGQPPDTVLNNAFPSSPAPETGSGENMPEDSVEYEAQYAAAVVEVTVRSISEPRANTASGAPPTAVPGSLITDPTSENALYKTLVLDIDTIYHSESSPPDGWVIPVYSGTTANGPPTRSDIPRLPLDVNDVHVGDKALVYIYKNPWRVPRPIDSYSANVASQFSSGDDDYDAGVSIHDWYLIVDNTVVDGLSQHVFSLDNLRSRLVAFFAPTVTPTSTSTVTSTPSSTSTPTPTPTPTPASFEPVADSYTLSTQPTQNYGTQSVLDVRGGSSPFYRSYLQFNVSGLSGTVLSASLRLWVSDTSVDYGQVGSVANGWTETGLTWNNQPSMPMTFLTVLGPENGYVTVDVSTEITGNGTFSFGIQSLSTDLAAFGSRDDSNVDRRPLLIVVTQ